MNIKEEKIEILGVLLSSLLGMVEQAKSAMADAQAEANYHIGAMQSRYDTFKEEAQYLVAAQQIRLIELEKQIAQCEIIKMKLSSEGYRFSKVEMGAFFSVVKNAESRKSYFVVPGGNGLVVDINNVKTLCVSIEAPVIRPYIGLSEGDEPDNEMCDEFIDEII